MNVIRGGENGLVAEEQSQEQAEEDCADTRQFEEEAEFMRDMLDRLSTDDESSVLSSALQSECDEGTLRRVKSFASLSKTHADLRNQRTTLSKVASDPSLSAKMACSYEVNSRRLSELAQEHERKN